MLVLEERGRALARGAPIYAEVCGFGLTNDAHHMTAPRPDGAQAARAMRIALAEAHVAPGRGRLHQRPRLVHPAQRSDRDRLDQAGLRRARLPAGAERHQGLLRPRAGRERRHRGGHLRARQRAAAGCRPRSTSRRPDPACDLPYVTGDGRDLAPDVPAQQLLRLRRHQRGAGVSASGRLDSPPSRYVAVISEVGRCRHCCAAPSPRPSGPSRWCSSVPARWPPAYFPTPITACSASPWRTPWCCPS